MSRAEFEDDARRLLRRAGIRRTAPRVAVLSALLAAGRPLSIDRLAGTLTGREADKATVYRTLLLLVENGVAHRIDVGDRVLRFAALGNGRHRVPHAHFLCRKCGALECVDDGASPFPVHPVPGGHVVEEQEILLRGLCPECGPS